MSQRKTRSKEFERLGDPDLQHETRISNNTMRTLINAINQIRRRLTGIVNWDNSSSTESILPFNPDTHDPQLWLIEALRQLNTIHDVAVRGLQESGQIDLINALDMRNNVTNMEINRRRRLEDENRTLYRAEERVVSPPSQGNIPPQAPTTSPNQQQRRSTSVLSEYFSAPETPPPQQQAPPSHRGRGRGHF